MEKKRYEIQIAGAQLAIISDEREEFINTLVENLDAQIKEITVSSKRSSNLDAAILCALEYYSEKVKAEKRARNLEAQISLYDANLRRFREENIALREKLDALEKKGAAIAENANTVETEADAAAEAPAAEIPVSEETEKAAETAAEEENAAPASEDKTVSGDSRAARLRAIEELLGRGDKKGN